MLRLSRFGALLMAGVIVFAGSLAYAQLGNGIVAYWNFDGTFDDVGPGGNVNPGTPMGGLNAGNAFGGPAMFGQSLNLDGGSQEVHVLNESSFDFSGGGGFTMSTWARVDAFDTTWQALVAKGEGSEFRIHRQGNDQRLAFNAGGGGDLDSNTNINDGLYHHIVTRHGGGTTNEIWIDGVQVASAARGDVVDNNEPLMIGENPDAQNREWEGQIDDMAFWDRPLTDQEITDIFAGGQQGQSLGDLIGGGGAAIPEPTSVAIWTLIGLFGSLFAWRRWRRR